MAEDEYVPMTCKIIASIIRRLMEKNRGESRGGFTLISYAWLNKFDPFPRYYSRACLIACSQMYSPALFLVLQRTNQRTNAYIRDNAHSCLFNSFLLDNSPFLKRFCFFTFAIECDYSRRTNDICLKWNLPRVRYEKKQFSTKCN